MEPTRAREPKANVVTEQGDPWGPPGRRADQPYGDWPAPMPEWRSQPAQYAFPIISRSTVLPPAPPPRRAHRLTALIAGAAALAVLLAGGAAVVDQQKLPFAAGPLTGVSVADAPHASDKPATPKSHVAPLPQLSVDQVAQLVKPGVVIINSTLAGQNAIAAGTGMVLTSTGEILTNNHVIDGASTISVTVASTGRRYDADLVGTSAANDVALIQLRGAGGLATIPLSTSGSVSVGTSVVAIGNAGGTGSLSVVTGTVTSTDRSITASDATGSSSERLSGMIEVEAQIRAGDSGGPLADRTGKVIGMDTAASATRRSGPTGPTYGFAIPINRAIAIAQSLRSASATGIPAAAHGYFGIEVRGSDPATNAGGAVIIAVTPGSPASRAGLIPGDTITDVQGGLVTSSNSLTRTLQNTKAGQRVLVGWVDSAGRSHHANVTLASGPAD
jgi:S1-C subfamily serine protease